MDSLQADLSVQRQYLDVIKQLTAGDIETDSVQSLDSLQRVERAQIQEQQRNDVTELFKEQYEQKERDRLMLYDNTGSRTVSQFCRPVRGAIMQSASPEKEQYAVVVRTAKNENVLSIARGHIIMEERAEDNTFTIVVQHASLMSVYRHVSKTLKTPGTQVEAGEAIGMMDGSKDLELEIWESGTFINPEEVIVW